MYNRLVNPMTEVTLSARHWVGPYKEARLLISRVVITLIWLALPSSPNAGLQPPAAPATYFWACRSVGLK